MKQISTTREIDFIINTTERRIYIQSTYAIPDKAKMKTYPFILAEDSFQKILVRGDSSGRWYDENGFLNIGIIDFLLDKAIFQGPCNYSITASPSVFIATVTALS